jgi:hypothetical protein
MGISCGFRLPIPMVLLLFHDFATGPLLEECSWCAILGPYNLTTSLESFSRSNFPVFAKAHT